MLNTSDSCRRTVLILTEAGPDIGMGHVTRCNSLASKIENRGCQVKLWVHADQDIALLGDLTSRSWWMGDPALLEEARTSDLVILDSFRISPPLLALLESQCRNLAVIDDFPRRSYGKIIVVDWTVGAQESWFPESNACKYLLGPRYCSLRPAFCKQKLRKKFNLRRILVTFGGTDVRSLTGPCLREIRKAFPELEIHVVARNLTAPILVEFEQRSDLRLHSDLDDCGMASLMRQCDLAICGGGQTLYELASCGCPAVVVGLIDNQMDDIRGFDSAGCIHYVGKWDVQDLWSRVVGAVRGFQDSSRLMEFSRKGSALVDGQGADRLASELLGSLKERFHGI